MILLLVMDPIGNVPFFAVLLRDVEPARRSRIIIRECLIAFAVLLVFILFGRLLLHLLSLSESALNIAGGIILFLIAVRMVFRNREGLFGDELEGEPFIVPLAIPAVAGPAAIATVILFASRAPQRLVEWIVALTIAIGATLALLLFAERVTKLIGQRGLIACERLMGLLLTAIAVEMLLRGIQTFVQQLSAA
jgi:MarC family membrane protein